MIRDGTLILGPRGRRRGHKATKPGPQQAVFWGLGQCRYHVASPSRRPEAVSRAWEPAAVRPQSGPDGTPLQPRSVARRAPPSLLASHPPARRASSAPRRRTRGKSAATCVDPVVVYILMGQFLKNRGEWRQARWAFGAMSPNVKLGLAFPRGVHIPSSQKPSNSPFSPTSPNAFYIPCP